MEHVSKGEVIGSVHDPLFLVAFISGQTLRMRGREST